MTTATYRPESPCPHGHFERYLKDNKCAVCGRIYGRKTNAAKNKKYRQANLEKSRAQQRENYAKHRIARLAQKAEYERLNRPKRNAIHGKRRADQLNATPKWLTVWQHMEMTHMYTKARELWEQDGTPRHVDHIIPLRGRTAEGCPVSGLHVPWNLQLLEDVANMRKSNVIDYDWIILPPGPGHA